MAPLRHAFPLALCLILAGCTFLGGDENSGPDKSEYDGGIGFALAIHNAGEDPFNVTLRVLGVGNAELARVEEVLASGQTLERWYGLESRSTYSARMEYTWNAASGSTSHGLDDQTFAAQDCPLVSRLSWELRQDNNTVGHAFLGKTCVTEE